MTVLDFLSKLPRHDCTLSLIHNQHKSYFQTVEESIKAGDFGYDVWVNDEQRDLAVKMNECWIIQWYPDSPVGFCTLSAYSLEVLLSNVGEQT